MGIVIRPLEKDDLDRGFIETLAENWNVDERSKLMFDRIKSSNNYNFVAIDHGTVVGHVCLHCLYKFAWGGSMVGFIEDVVVRKSHRGQGLGQRLVQVAVDKAKELGCYRVTLTCEEGLVGFYEKTGFRSDLRSMKQLLKGSV